MNKRAWKLNETIHNGSDLIDNELCNASFHKQYCLYTFDGLTDASSNSLLTKFIFAISVYIFLTFMFQYFKKTSCQF